MYYMSCQLFAACVTWVFQFLFYQYGRASFFHSPASFWYLSIPNYICIILTVSTCTQQYMHTVTNPQRIGSALQMLVWARDCKACDAAVGDRKQREPGEERHVGRKIAKMAA